MVHTIFPKIVFMDYDGMAEEVQSICGSKYSKVDIIQDLRYTFSVEETTNRILDGSFLDGVREVERSESSSTLVSQMIHHADAHSNARLATIPIQIDSDSSDEDFLPKSAQKSHLSQEIEDLSISGSISLNLGHDTQPEAIVLDSDDDLLPFRSIPSTQLSHPPRYVFQSLSDSPIPAAKKFLPTATANLSEISVFSDDEDDAVQPVKEKLVQKVRVVSSPKVFAIN
jgi:hypothetical protein